MDHVRRCAVSRMGLSLVFFSLFAFIFFLFFSSILHKACVSLSLSLSLIILGFSLLHWFSILIQTFRCYPLMAHSKDALTPALLGARILHCRISYYMSFFSILYVYFAFVSCTAFRSLIYLASLLFALCPCALLLFLSRCSVSCFRFP